MRARDACLRDVNGADTLTVREPQHLNDGGIVAAEHKVAVGIKCESPPNAANPQNLLPLIKVLHTIA